MRLSWDTFVRVVATILVVAIATWHALPVRGALTAAIVLPAVAASSEASEPVASGEPAPVGDDRGTSENGRAGDTDGEETETESESEDEERSESVEALLVALLSHAAPEGRAAFDIEPARCPDEAPLEVASPPPEA